MTARKPLGQVAKECALILVGSFIYAIGVDAFEIPVGLAAGGLTGLATVIAAVGESVGLTLPVGIQTIAMNAALLLFVYLTTHDRGYIAQSVLGIIVSGVLTDALAPLVPVPAPDELLLCAIWGGVAVGVGIGIVFLSGGNTGGTDIVCQLLARRTGISVGILALLVDGAIVALSIPVFSLRNALYAAIALYVSGRVMDMVVDGPLTARVAYVISDRHHQIANRILYEMRRGCTEVQARGVWSGKDRPMLMCVMGRSESQRLKRIVSEEDPDAIIIVSEVHEAFGEGFGRLGG